MDAIPKTTMFDACGLAEKLGVSRALVSRWTKEGCPCVYIGRVMEPRRGSRPRYNLAEVETWLKTRAAGKRGEVEA